MMGVQAKPSTRQLLALSTAIVLFAGTAQLRAEKVAGPNSVTEDRPGSPDQQSATDVGDDQDWFDAADAKSPSEAARELQDGADWGMHAPVYPIFQENCRASRVYRSPLLGRLWARGEYLLWGMKGVDLPALVTTSPLGTVPDVAGVLRKPGTSVLFGDESIYDEMRSGGRFTLGWWWDLHQMGGVEATYFGLPAKALRHHSHGWGNRIVARPYLNVNTDVQDAHLVAYPDFPDGSVDLDGSVDVRADTELQGAEVLLRRVVLCRPALRVDFLAGYRFGRLIDRLTIDEFSESSESFDPPPDEDYPYTVVTINNQRFDLFKSTNDFHGGEFGLTARWCRGRWSVRLLGKVAVGGTVSRCIVDGRTTITTTTTTHEDEDTTNTDTDADPPYPGGLLALPFPSNIGYHTDTELAFQSELGVSLDYQLTCDLRVSVGYDVLHWNRVARAAEQIDLRINPTRIPPETPAGRPRPKFAWRTTDFWAQGLNICIEQQF